MSSSTFDPIPLYLEGVGRHEVQRLRFAQQSRRIAWTRVLLFLAGAACLVLAIPGGDRAATLLVAAGALFVTFFVLVYVHSKVEEREQWHETVARVNREAVARVKRDWHALPESAAAPAAEEHPYAGDLDLLGHASLFQLLEWAGTEPGRDVLRTWLLTPAPADSVRARQEAVRELAPQRGLRENLAAQGRLLGREQNLERFFEWAESGGWLRKRLWMSWAARLSATATLLFIALHVAGFTGAWWVPSLLVNVALMVLLERRAHETFNRAFARQRSFQRHAAIFRTLCDANFSSPRLRQLQEELRASGVSVPKAINRLGLLMQLADLRLQAFFHFPINLVSLWDIQVLDALERWQAQHGPMLRRWFAVLGEMDALAALASLAHDNPDWTFPEVTSEADRVTASALGHPLIPAERRVANDVEVGPPGRVLLVTGSNMSGKSTLLRSIGINIVLAQAGAPVCAAAMRMPPLAVYTSMRVHDSLEAGVSYFMAALQRLKLIVAAADAVPPGGPRLLYLLDEILQGTNTAERQVAVRRILGHLLKLPVIGAVTTHDLELASSPDLAEFCETVHFTEGVDEHDGGARLSFDYRLRRGVATSRNALKLLRLVGLDQG